MNFILFHPPVKNLQDKTVDELPHNTPAAIELPDDTLQTKDHPFMHTEECIAAGCPEDLW